MESEITIINYGIIPESLKEIPAEKRAYLATCRGCSLCRVCLSAAKSQSAGGARPVSDSLMPAERNTMHSWHAARYPKTALLSLSRAAGLGPLAVTCPPAKLIKTGSKLGQGTQLKTTVPRKSSTKIQRHFAISGVGQVL